MLLAFVRWVGAVVGFFFGFYLGAQLLEVTEVSPTSNKVVVVFLLGIACSMLGWLGAPYVTIQPGQALARRIRESAFGDLVGGSTGAAFGPKARTFGQVRLSTAAEAASASPAATTR